MLKRLLIPDVAKLDGADVTGDGFGAWRQVTLREPPSPTGEQGAILATEALSGDRVATLEQLLGQRYRYAWQLVRAVLFMRATGQAPLDFSLRLSRARLYQTAEIMAQALIVAPQMWQVASIKNGGGCPFLGGQ